MERLGKYQVIRVLGEGGMGRVYEAVDPMIGRRVAIKTISLNILNDADMRARFLREAQAAGGLSHPNLITIHDVGEHDGHPYIVMEYLQGQDLSHVIKSGHLPLDDKLRVMTDVCQGLAYAHARGVIHRDIKPANIFVTTQGQIKIVDFGLARGAMSEFTRTGNVLGTPNYMAPEQLRSEGTDTRADIFAAGIVFYELLTGQKAFDGDSAAAMIYKVLQLQLEPVHTFDAQLPPRLSEIVGRALEKDRNARYQTVDDMLADIVRVRQDMEPGRAGGVPSVSEPTRELPSAGQRHETGLMTPQGPQAAVPQDPRRWPFDWRWAAAVVAVAGVGGIFLLGRSTAIRPPPVVQPAAPPVAAQPPTAQPLSAQPPTAPPTTAPPPVAPATAPRSAAPGAASGPPGGPLPGRGSTAAQGSTREPQPPTVTRPEQTAVPPEPPPRPIAESAPRPAADGTGRESSPPRPVETPAPRVETPRAPAAAAEPPPPPAVTATPPTLFATPAPAENPVAAVQSTLARYKVALESRNLGALKQIWPALVGRQEAAIRMEFDNARSIAVDFENVSVRVDNTAATLTCRRNYIVTTVQGQTLRTATRMTMTLDRRNGLWLIDGIRHEVER